MSADVQRVVALGASNLTRGFHTIVSTARATWGPAVDVVAALGHGRSYGSDSRVLVRTLPGILQSGLWHHLDSSPRVATRALLTDVGNDILYGFTAPQILAWVEEAIQRLERITRDITITDLPLTTIRELSPAKFLACRSVLFPSCRLSFARVLETAEAIDVGLGAIAQAHGLPLVHLRKEWYGFDPIHIRPSLWRPAWQEILGAASPALARWKALPEGFRLYIMRPERQWLFGVEQVTPQTGMALAGGARVWLF